MITIQQYVRPQTLEEAYQLNQNKRNRIIGGMLWLKMSNARIHTAIDLCDLGLNAIEENEDVFHIGAMVTLRDLELHEGLNRFTNGAVAKAVHDIVGTQFRNMATVGGSVFGRFGFSDVLTVLLALDTHVELYHGGTIPLEAFITQPRDRDLLTGILIRKQPTAISYQAVRNARTDFPVLTCAVSKHNGTYFASVGARPARAMLHRDELGILSQGLTEESITAFAEYIATHTPTQSNLRGGADYRSHLVRVLCRRALREIGGMNDGN